MIPPRGCAYIVMVHRQDANTALNKLSKGSYKVNQKPVKVHSLFHFIFISTNLPCVGSVECILIVIIS